ncbi:hypothetical protein Tco_1116567, partial [Tanacetum coccineum]
MQWLADKFKIHEELDPLTMDGLRDYWKKVVNGNEISEYEENTNEEFDNQDTPYALWNEQDHAEQSSSHECHALDPPEAAYYNKSDDPDEEYIARRLQIVKKVIHTAHAHSCAHAVCHLAVHGSLFHMAQ